MCVLFLGENALSTYHFREAKNQCEQRSKEMEGKGQ